MKTRLINGAGGLLLAVLGTALAATGSIAQVKKWRIGSAVYGLQNEYAQRWVADIAKHPAVKAGLVDMTVFDGKYDHLTQRGQFDTMETQKFDGAIYVPIDSKACDAVVEKAQSESLPVVGSNSLCATKAAAAYIGSDDVQAGRDVAETVIGQIKGGDGVVELEGPVGQLGAIQRGQGMHEVLAKHPEIKLLWSKTANGSRQEAFKIVRDWIVAHPGQIKGVLAQNDDMALGAIRALKAANVDPKTVAIAGIDGVTDAVRAVDAGEMILSVAQDPNAQAQGALDIMLRKLVGPSYKPQSDIWETYKNKMPWSDGTAARYNVPWTYIRANNVERFLKEGRRHRTTGQLVLCPVSKPERRAGEGVSMPGIFAEGESAPASAVMSGTKPALLPRPTGHRWRFVQPPTAGPADERAAMRHHLIQTQVKVAIEPA